MPTIDLAAHMGTFSRSRCLRPASAEDRTMAIPVGESGRSAINGLRQYLADNLPRLREHLLTVIRRMPRLREHLLELTYKLTNKPADDGQAKRMAHLRTTNDGLQAHLAKQASPVTSLQDAPDSADQQRIGDLIRWWMRHDPLRASQCVVEAVGLGGAHRLSEGDRLKLARTFLAMLDVDPTGQSHFELDQATVSPGQGHNGSAAPSGSPTRRTARRRPTTAP